MREWIEENRGFWLLLACTLIPVFFQLDRLLGAVGLRAAYADASFVLASFLVILGLFLGLVLSPTTSFAVKMVSFLPIAVLFFLILERITTRSEPLVMGFILLTWFTAPTTALVVMPPIVYLIAALILIVLKLAFAFDVILTNFLKIPDSLIVGVALVMGLSVFSLGVTYNEGEFGHRGSVQAGDHLYHLQVAWGFLGDPSTMVLYECTSDGLNCEPVYRMNEWDDGGFHFTGMSVELRPSADSNGLQILVDGEVKYTYVSASTP